MSLLLYPQLIAAIDIHDIRWGFNNRPVAYKINPVSILVENNEPTPFESNILFQQKTIPWSTDWPWSFSHYLCCPI